MTEFLDRLHFLIWFWLARHVSGATFGVTFGAVVAVCGMFWFAVIPLYFEHRRKLWLDRRAEDSRTTPLGREMVAGLERYCDRLETENETGIPSLDAQDEHDCF